MAVASFFCKLHEIGLCTNFNHQYYTMRRKQVTLLLEKRNSLDDDSDYPEGTHYNTSILDALDEMDLIEVDDDPDADQTDSDDDELNEFKTLDATTRPGEPLKIPTPPLTISKKQKRGTS